MTHCLRGPLGDQTQQPCLAIGIGIANQDDARAQTTFRRPAECQLAQVDDRYRRATVVEDPRDSRGRPENLLDAYERQDFGDLAGIQRIPVLP